jgi:hypothetical protein
MTAAPKFKWGLSGKNYTDPAEYDAAALLGPAVKIVALPADGTTFDPPKMIIADKAGTATVTDCLGEAIPLFPLTGGEQHVSITALNALATATKVWGLY